MEQLQKANIDEFKVHFRGDVLLPDEAGYDEVRQIWNAMIDRRPALVVRCLGSGDVIACVQFARANDLLLCIKGGGHNIAGLATRGVERHHAVLDRRQLHQLPDGGRKPRAHCRGPRQEPRSARGDQDGLGSAERVSNESEHPPGRPYGVGRGAIGSTRSSCRRSAPPAARHPSWCDAPCRPRAGAERTACTASAPCPRCS